MAWLGDLGSAILGGLYELRVPVGIGSVLAAIGLVLLARRLGWIGTAKRHPRASAAVLVPLLAIALPVGWYLTSPLVLSATIDEAPSIVAGARDGIGSAGPSVRPSVVLPSSAPVASPTASPEPTASPDPTRTPAPLTARSGPFHGSDEFHFGRGTARLIETAPGTFVVRLQDFAVRNGPDLYVYISPDADSYADGAIELGRLKADRGNQNYAVPAGALADPSRAASVVIWCKQFSHLFATAPLGG